VKLVQKSVAIGALAGALAMVSVSALSALAVRMPDTAGMTLAAVARVDGFGVFTHPYRANAVAQWGFCLDIENGY
jgi:FdhD protein